jgi:Mlc titration factor MtfA (ptsG expression regulator)
MPMACIGSTWPRPWVARALEDSARMDWRMWDWLNRWRHSGASPRLAHNAVEGALGRWRGASIPDDLWLGLLARYPFLRGDGAQQEQVLREMCMRFLRSKEFHGAGGLEITDPMALAIAAQACLPVLALGLHWYDDFVGIVVHPGEVLARREVADEAGVVHRYSEVLVGEAMHQGPVMLSWHDVQQAGADGEHPYNVVIHEFAHKLDLRDGAADGCPPLPAGFLGTGSAAAARRVWFAALNPEYETFRENVTIAERFSGTPTWLDPYAATSIDEFFAVACEAYFVDRARFKAEHARLMPLFDGFFGNALSA